MLTENVGIGEIANDGNVVSINNEFKLEVLSIKILKYGEDVMNFIASILNKKSSLCTFKIIGCYSMYVECNPSTNPTSTDHHCTICIDGHRLIPNTNQCERTCPKYWLMNELKIVYCVSDCPASYPYLLDTAHDQCVSICPSPLVALQNQCISECPLNTKFYEGKCYHPCVPIKTTAITVTFNECIDILND